jgi:hypothetical protein
VVVGADAAPPEREQLAHARLRPGQLGEQVEAVLPERAALRVVFEVNALKVDSVHVAFVSRARSSAAVPGSSTRTARAPRACCRVVSNAASSAVPADRESAPPAMSVVSLSQIATGYRPTARARTEAGDAL